MIRNIWNFRSSIEYLIQRTLKLNQLDIKALSKIAKTDYILTVPCRTLPAGGRPVPPVQAFNHRSECACDCASLPTVRAVRGREPRHARCGRREGSAREPLVRRRGLAGSARRLLGLLAVRPRRVSAGARTHSCARLATALPSRARQVQEQQVSIYWRRR